MSDHFSGPRALAGPAGDITDFYAFPSPERPGHLVLVLTSRPWPSPTRPSRTRSTAASGCGRTIAGSGAATAFPFAGADQERLFTCHSRRPSQMAMARHPCKTAGSCPPG